MERLLLEYFFRATLVLGGVAIILRITGVKAAAAKHRVWTGALGLMLILPIWTAWGPRVPFRLLAPPTHVTAGGSIIPDRVPETVARPSPPLSTGQAALVLVYLSGLFLLLFRLAIGTIRARQVVNSAVLRDSLHISSLCAAPVTVGFFHPVIILPENWHDWRRTQLEAVLTHEGEHVRRRHSLVQWLALLNRALFWFHPAVWWLERHLSALAEEACDDLVLARGHNARDYAECLIDIARSVTRSGARLKVTGMALPGRLLQQRIRRVMEGGQASHASRTRMVLVSCLCGITCTAFAAGELEHVRQNASAQHIKVEQATEPTTHPGEGFIFSDLVIEGEVHRPDAVKDRILKAWKDKEFGNSKELADSVAGEVRRDFQQRGYFMVVVQEPVSRLLGMTDGKQRVLVTVSVTEGNEFRLGNLTFQNMPSTPELSIPAATLREQFHIGTGELFNVTEIRAGMARVKELYGTRGYPDAKIEPVSDVDKKSRRINLTLRVAEGTHKSQKN